MTAFSADAARALQGPDWLRVRRSAAAERFAGSPWPSTDEEVWRYSRVADLDLDRYALGTGPADTASATATARVAAASIAPDLAALVVVASGRVISVDIAAAWQARGLFVGLLADAADGERVLGSVASEPPDIFAMFNDAFASAPVLVQVARSVDVTAPVVVVHLAPGGDELTCPRLVVDVGENASIDVVDVHIGSAGGLSVPLVELAVGQAGRLNFVAVQDLPLDTWQVGSQLSTVSTDATLTSATIALGGDYARHRTDCRLVGSGATGNLVAAYFGEGDQTLDFRTFQDHAAPDTTSNLLFKGAVGGRSRSVYTGLIRVRKQARGTNAFQTNRNLKLSDEAWAESVPNLEIENNDVRCSHASAVGPIDEEQRFYLESRGVPPRAAERLVVAGFFGEVLEALPASVSVEPLREAVGGKLARQVDDE